MVHRLIWALVFCIAFPLTGAIATEEEWYTALKEATKTGTCDDLLRHLERGKQSRLYPLGLGTAANALERGWCGPKDIALAIDLYRKAAKLGHNTAKIRLGRMHYLGAGVPRDAVKARYWFRGAVLALLSHPAEWQLNEVTNKWTTDGVLGPLKNELEWMRRLASSEPRKRMEIARKLLDGDGVPPDPDAARDWIASAADDELPAAMLVHARWMLEGRVKELTRKQGANLLRKTAERDYVPAMTELARRLEFGEGMERDWISAYVWLLRAGWRGAETGDALQRVGGFLTAKEKKSAAETARAPYL